MMLARKLIRPLLPRAIKSHRILAGPLAGRRIVTSWRDYPAGITGITERPLLAWFASQVAAGETWIDVGAHYGYTAIALSRLVGTTGRVFAFEPIPSTAACIVEASRLNRLDQMEVLALGLGQPASIESIDLPVTRGMADSTLERNSTSQIHQIRVARFDWLWSQICGPTDRIDGIKIDVQGMELDVLAGMEQALSRYRPKLVVEFHHGVSREAVLGILRRNAYDVTPIPIDALSNAPPEIANDRSYAFFPSGAGRIAGRVKE